MPRARSEFVCRECGYRTPRPLGRCPECEAWSSFDEVFAASPPPARRAERASAAPRPVRLDEIDGADVARLPTGIAEFSRVMGGGVVPGSVTLVGGDPGVGKSTLLSQVADRVARGSGSAVYISAEESLAQVALRARRMGLDAPDLLFLSETDADAIAACILDTRPGLAIVDSIQAISADGLAALPGTVSQVRECTQRLLQVAKSSGTPLMLVGHVTKEGAIAGPRLLEHMVDTVLYLEGERFSQYRLLRSTKNRFGPTDEVGVFEMRGQGLEEILNPSAAFLAERAEPAPGSVVTVSLEGTRPMLGEVQALVSRSSLAIPRRTANGFDTNRLHLITAVLGRRLGLPLYDQDVYLNVVGGLRLEEPAADLAAALAIVSSMRDRALPSDLVAVGEVGLSGELRSVRQLGQRLSEARKLGFARAIVPRAHQSVDGMDVLAAATLREAVRALEL